MSLIDLIERASTESSEPTQPKPSRSGKIIACWGSAGSGKSMLAVNLAFELADLAKRVLLIDLDNRRPCLAPALGLTDPGPGLTAILRLARLQRLDLAELDRLSHNLRFGKRDLRFISGLNSPNRWAEIGSLETEGLFRLAREEFDYVVVDLNDELDTAILGTESSVSRNLATNKTLEHSDVVLGTFSADPVGVNRFLWDLKSASVEVWPIANRVRTSVVGRNPERQVKDALYKASGLQVKSSLPEDSLAVDAAMAQAASLSIAAKGSKLREAIRALALDLEDA